MAELPRLASDEAPAAKLLRTAGGEKGEGGVPLTEKDAGRAMGHASPRARPSSFRGVRSPTGGFFPFSSKFLFHLIF